MDTPVATTSDNLRKRKNNNDDDNQNYEHFFDLHCDEFPAGFDERTVLTIGSDDKIMKFRNEDGLEVVIKIPHGTVVTLNRVVAGVDLYGHDEKGKPQFIKHGVYNIDSSFVFACHRKDDDSVDGPSKIAYLSENQQQNNDHSALLTRNEIPEEELVERLMKANEWRFVSGSQDFLKDLFCKGLVIYQYQFDNAQLSKDIDQMIEDGIFVDSHSKRKGKIAWLGTGGPAFFRRVPQIVLRRDSFVKFLQWHAQIFQHGTISKLFFIAYESSIE